MVQILSPNTKNFHYPMGGYEDFFLGDQDSNLNSRLSAQSWGARIRTWILAFKGRCPTIRRLPSFRRINAEPMSYLSASGGPLDDPPPGNTHFVLYTAKIFFRKRRPDVVFRYFSQALASSLFSNFSVYIIFQGQYLFVYICFPELCSLILRSILSVRPT